MIASISNWEMSVNKTEFSVFELRRHLWFAEKKKNNLDDVLDKQRKKLYLRTEFLEIQT